MKMLILRDRHSDLRPLCLHGGLRRADLGILEGLHHRHRDDLKNISKSCLLVITTRGDLHHWDDLTLRANRFQCQ